MLKQSFKSVPPEQLIGKSQNWIHISGGRIKYFENECSEDQAELPGHANTFC